ncbi:uncharacterized protein BXZ73DRAFT_59511 [Epithele typhae]|uniref:uncharacterized protein n=1 Tax=Epithele typhae TaxID=378194 RepID=UPI00200835C5|nr:uncharacterized protein BXZ73DRAFT_59511 [Epithele typhae]KAH9909423.1 hypothetical protein BXZ73DRAFT_59511 [Epithele typhae]
MHNLFLGEVRHHFRDIWGLEVKDSQKTRDPSTHSPEDQKKWIDHVVKALRTRSLSSLRKARRGYLVAFCQLNGIVPTETTKAHYAAALSNWVNRHSSDDVDAVDLLQVPPPLSTATENFHIADNAYDVSKHQVFTASIIGKVRSDIKGTYLPSWLERPPSNFGSSSHGKLKADHWRTICTISLVISLVKIWPHDTASSSELKVLENFVHLAIAVDLASRRSMSPERARLFDAHMASYLRGIREIFDHDLVPNHHLSLHLCTCLLLFGPVHGWWAFPFERFNGIIQRLNTNNKIDEIPLSYMRLFCLGSRLRHIFDSTDWPDEEEFDDLTFAFRQMYPDTTQGSRIVDTVSAASKLARQNSLRDLFNRLMKKETQLPEGTYAELMQLLNHCGSASADGAAAPFIAFPDTRDLPSSRLHRRAIFIPKLELGNITYGTRDDNIRNSFVCVRDPLSSDTTSAPIPGQISQIFLHRRTTPDHEEDLIEPFIVIDLYATLSQAHSAHDPYLRFPLLNTKLVYDRFSRSILIRPEHIVCHFARLLYQPDHISEACNVVRALGRVCVLHAFPTYMSLIISCRTSCASVLSRSR